MSLTIFTAHGLISLFFLGFIFIILIWDILYKIGGKLVITEKKLVYRSWFFHRELNFYEIQGVENFSGNFSRIKFIPKSIYSKSSITIYKDISDFLGLKKWALEKFPNINSRSFPYFLLLIILAGGLYFWRYFVK